MIASLELALFCTMTLTRSFVFFNDITLFVSNEGAEYVLLFGVLVVVIAAEFPAARRGGPADPGSARRGPICFYGATEKSKKTRM